jgi:hypothetical protein
MAEIYVMDHSITAQNFKEIYFFNFAMLCTFFERNHLNKNSTGIMKIWGNEMIEKIIVLRFWTKL